MGRLLTAGDRRLKYAKDVIVLMTDRKISICRRSASASFRLRLVVSFVSFFVWNSGFQSNSPSSAAGRSMSN